jgi:predicted nucleotidyltransferase
LKFPFIAIIFGSYAKGTKSKTSDIDLMIISESDKEKIFERIVNLLPLDIHLVAFNYDQFLSMAKNRDFSVVSEALHRNIILIGIEDYYRMLEDVK